MNPDLYRNGCSREVHSSRPEIQKKVIVKYDDFEYEIKKDDAEISIVYREYNENGQCFEAPVLMLYTFLAKDVLAEALSLLNE